MVAQICLEGRTARVNLRGKISNLRWRRLGGRGAARPILWLPTLWLVVLWLLAAAVRADTIYLKDGKTVSGIIDPKKSDQNQVIINSSAGTFRIPRNKVDRIESRQNISEDERQGDLAAHEQDYDRALESYLKALAGEKENKDLAAKVADMKTRIKERDDKRFGQQFAKIDQLMGDRKFQAAIDLAQGLADKTEEGSGKRRCLSKVADAYVALARESRNLVNYPEAEKAYRSAIAAYPAGPGPQFELAELVQGYPTRKREAFELFKHALELTAKDPTLVDKSELLRYRYAYAELYRDANQFREAALIYWDIAQADPKQQKFPQAMDLVVKCYSSLQSELVPDKEENRTPLEILTKIADAHPYEDKAHLILGKIYYDRSDYPHAIPMLETALKNMGTGFGMPIFADCRYYLGIAYRKSGRDKDAVQQLRALLELEPTRYEAICELGEIYFGLGDYTNALTQFNTGLKVEPSTYRAYLGAARTLRRVNRLPEAVTMYEQLIKLKDDNPDYFFELGLTYAAVNRQEEARKVYDKVVELMKTRDPNDPVVKQRLGEVHSYIGLADVALKKYNEAIEVFDKSLGYRPGYPRSLDGKGRAYRELGQLAQAEDFFKQALTADPTNPEFSLSLGVLYHKFKKDTQGALPYYLDYFKKGGSDPQVADWIRECGGTPPGPS